MALASDQRTMSLTDWPVASLKAATTAGTLFTLAFIFSYETESGYRHTLQIAVLSLGWPCALVVIAVAFATVTFLEFRRAGMHLAAARTCDAARSHLRQKAGAGHRADIHAIMRRLSPPRAPPRSSPS